MVKKIKKYLKFVVCCALIMSLVAPSYAALSASDGSAFVTKAEFDTALADFNARLTTFEAGINSKIDSQVTSYLDRNGIWNGKVQDLELFVKYGVYDTRQWDMSVAANWNAITRWKPDAGSYVGGDDGNHLRQWFPKWRQLVGGQMDPILFHNAYVITRWAESGVGSGYKLKWGTTSYSYPNDFLKWNGTNLKFNNSYTAVSGTHAYGQMPLGYISISKSGLFQMPIEFMGLKSPATTGPSGQINLFAFKLMPTNGKTPADLNGADLGIVNTTYDLAPGSLSVTGAVSQDQFLVPAQYITVQKFVKKGDGFLLLMAEGYKNLGNFEFLSSLSGWGGFNNAISCSGSRWGMDNDPNFKDFMPTWGACGFIIWDCVVY